MVETPYDSEEVAYDPMETDLTESSPSKEKALNEDEFEKLLEGAEKLDSLYDIQARLTILLAGRLGMRNGEITHMKRHWIDFDSKEIHVPAHEPCDMGIDGTICGSCKQLARQMSENNDITVEEAEDLFWKAKSAEAERDIPYGWSQEVTEIVETFFERFEDYFGSQASLNRRVNDSLEKAEGLSKEDTTPHGLRSTAASYHAKRGLNVWGLQGLMGWAYPQTAQNYVVYEGQRIKQSLDGIHNDNDSTSK